MKNWNSFMSKIWYILILKLKRKWMDIFWFFLRVKLYSILIYELKCVKIKRKFKYQSETPFDIKKKNLT